MANVHAFFFCSEAAAETEPAWQGAGEKPGLEVWRIVVSSPQDRSQQQKKRMHIKILLLNQHEE